jgi:hypothetical protein
MEAIVKNNQSLVDLAIEYLGDASAAPDIALLNGISLTDVLEPGTSLLLPEAKATTSEALPVAAPVTEASLLQLLTAHTAIMGGAVAGHVRNGGDVRIDPTGRMWVALLSDHADWANIDNKPLTFPPSLHTHAWSGITDKPLLFPPSAHNQDWSTIDNKPATFPPSAHYQDWSTIDNKPATFPPSAHTHIPQSVSAQSSGTLTLPVPSVIVLSTTLTSANSITIIPAVPTSFSSAQCVSVKFSIGASAANILFTPPAGVTYEWPDGMLTSFSINKKYSVTFVYISEIRYDVLWRSW